MKIFKKTSLLAISMFLLLFSVGLLTSCEEYYSPWEDCKPGERYCEAKCKCVKIKATVGHPEAC